MSFHWTICFQCSLNPFHKEIILPWKNLDSRQLASIIWRCLTWFIKFMIFFFKILHFDSFFPFLLRHASSTFFFFFLKNLIQFLYSHYFEVFLKNLLWYSVPQQMRKRYENVLDPNLFVILLLETKWKRLIIDF